MQSTGDCIEIVSDIGVCDKHITNCAGFRLSG